MDSDGRDGNGPSEPDEPPIRFQGDEADLYLEFNSELVKTLSRCVFGARPEDIEDAAAFAWVQFFRYQPDRDQPWQGWLFRTAQHEAWKLNAARREHRSITSRPKTHEIGDEKEPADPHDRLNQRIEFLAAMDEVQRLPKRM